MQREPIPRLPVFGWQALRGPFAANTPCLLDLPGLRYTTSGRAAILLALEALGVGAGDRVLLPTYHCPTMVAPAVSLGARPVFYPIDAQGGADLAWLDSQPIDGVRALLVAHFFGLPQPMAEIRRWCDRKGIALIEDCAHALFGRGGERPVGAWGDIAIGSLTKFLPVNEGGCLVVNGQGGEPFAAAVRTLRPAGLATHLRAAVDILEVGASQGALPGLNGTVSGGLGLLRRLRGNGATSAPTAEAAPADPALSAVEMGFDVSLAHRQPARLCQSMASALPRRRIVDSRRRNFENLRQALGGRDGLRPLLGELPPDCAPYVFPLWVDRPDPGYAELRRLGMPVFRWDRVWPGQQMLPGDQGLHWSHHVLQLGCHQDVSPAHLDRLVTTLLRLYDGRGPRAPAREGAHEGASTAAGVQPATPSASATR